MASPWAATCLAMKCPLLRRKERVDVGAQTASLTQRGDESVKLEEGIRVRETGMEKKNCKWEKQPHQLRESRGDRFCCVPLALRALVFPLRTGPWFSGEGRLPYCSAPHRPAVPFTPRLLSVTWSFRFLKSFSSCSLLFVHFG